MTKYTEVVGGVVTTVYHGPQDNSDKPNYVEMADDDARWTAYLLAEAKKTAKDAITAQREALLGTGVTTNGVTVAGGIKTVGAIAVQKDRVKDLGGALTKSITGITQANPAVFSMTASAPADELWVAVSGITTGPTELNGNAYQVYDSSGGTCKLKDRLGNPVDTSGSTAWSAGGTLQVACAVIEVDNSVTYLDYTTYLSVVHDLTLWNGLMYEQAQVHQDAVDALTTVGEVEAYDSSAWPT